ncbi:MAG: sodium:proton antiporter NhaD [Saprospiraceae bacterium]|nr:sodium:proton antiporter NhaD [Saprospiraceae bacterium]
MSAIVIFTFVIGYLAIVFEHPIKLDKTVPALVMAALCWAFISMGELSLMDHHMNQVDLAGPEHDHLLHELLLHHVGKTAEILIFLIGAMTIVELIDLHKGFRVITDKITTTKKSTMLWLLCPLSFFLSATLDNLACTIVIVSLLRRMVPDRTERLYFVSLAVITANAGGAWSPIGDVTTTMLWIGERITTQGLILSLVIPSIVCAVIPTFIMSKMPYMRGTLTLPETGYIEKDTTEVKGSKLMLFVGLAGLVFVPIFKTFTHLPPYVGMMLSLGMVWLVSEYLHPDEEFEDKHHYSAHNALSRIEMSSILFFLGILMAVAALESMGILMNLASYLDGVFAYDDGTVVNGKPVPNRSVVVVLLGIFSALIDNVPLVAAAMGMYSPIDNPADSQLWQFLAFSAGTGGSMLIIGSAAGVAAMGMEKIDFMWYLKNIAWLALIGFIAGAIVFLMLYPVIEGFLPEPEHLLKHMDIIIEDPH